jgi:Zn finger protein HypA/HybF involved in hydrogenase expression
MDFITVNAYNNYVEAHIAKGVLEEQGIACWLKDENTVTIDPILTNAVGGIKVMVPKEEAQRAWDILQALKKEKQLDVVCPKCGSHNIELVSTPRKAINWLSAISTFFLGDYAMAIDKVNHCFDCKHEFAETKEADSKNTEEGV